jgi:ankyrin repeat protein
LEAGADLDCRDHTGSNALSIAAEYGHFDLVVFMHECFSVSIYDDYKHVS